MVRFWGSVLAFKKLPFQHTSCLVRLFCEKTSKKHLRFIYKSCSWLAKLAFHLQTVHLILQTFISLTIVAIHFSNVASRFTIKHYTLGRSSLSSQNSQLVAIYSNAIARTSHRISIKPLTWDGSSINLEQQYFHTVPHFARDLQPFSLTNTRLDSR